MSEILRRWLTHSLGIILDLTPDKFGNNARDGRLIAHLLYNYDIISNVQLSVIVPTNDRNEARSNLKYIQIWLNSINIHCDDSIYDDIADCKGTAAIRLFYQLYLKLESPEKLHVAQNRRYQQCMPLFDQRFTVTQVTDELKQICGPENNPLAKPLRDHHDLIQWYKTKYNEIEAKIKETRLNYLQYVHEKCDEKVAKAAQETHQRTIDERDENTKIYEEFCKTISKFDIAQDKEYTYDDLLTLIRDAQPTTEYNSRITDDMMNTIKQKFRQTTAARKYKKKLETVIVHDLWNNILTKQEEDFDKLIAEKTLIQSEYEKQIVTKCYDVRNQKTIIGDNRRLVENLIAQRRDDEFSAAVLNRIDDVHESKRKYDFERERIIELHRKLYARKLQAKADDTYNLCKDTVNAFIDMAVKTVDYERLHHENVPEFLSNNWRALFLANQPVYDYLEHIESVINETPGPIENIIQMEFDRQNFLNQNDLFEYTYYLGQWQLSSLFESTRDQIDEAALNEDYMLLGHIVHRLLLLKYPIPVNLLPPKLPEFNIAACVTNVTDYSLMNVLKDLLKQSNIALIQIESAIHYVLKCFQAEMIGIDDIELKFFEDTVRWIEGFNNPSPNFQIPDSKQNILVETAKKKVAEKVKPSKKKEKVPAIEKVEKTTQTPKKLPESLVKEDFTHEAILGQYVYESLVLGKPLTDHAMAAIIVAYLKTLSEYNGYVLFNYPNTVKQAVVLEHEITAKMPEVDRELGKVIHSMDDVMPSLEYLIIERSDQRIQKDAYKGKRRSKLVPNPNTEIAAYNDEKHVSFLTAFITARKEKKADYENRKPTEMFTGDDPLETFYTNQGVHYILYYERFDFETIVYLAKLIIGDFSIPIKNSADLFGSIYEELKLIYNKKPNKKGGKNEQNITKNTPHHTQSISEFVEAESMMEESRYSIDEKSSETIKKYSNLPISPILANGVATVWENMEIVYLHDIKELFFIKRANRDSIMPYCTYIKDHMTKFITRPHNKQSIVQKFQYDYNSINDDLRDDGNLQAELHCRVDELRNMLWLICDERMRESENERQRIINDHWITDQMVLLTNLFINLMQIELNRCADTLQVIQDYYLLMTVGKLEIDDVINKPELKKVETIVRRIEFSKRGDMTSDYILPPKYKNDHPKEYTREGLQINREMANILVNSSESQFESTPFIKYITKNEAIAFKEIELWTEGVNKLIKLPSVTTNQTTSTKKLNVEDEIHLEWSDAVNIEKRRIKQRIKAITTKAFIDLKEFFTCAKNTFTWIFDNISEQYENEIKSVQTLCEVFGKAIEDQVRIQHELVIDNKDFLVYQDTLLYPFKPPEPKPPITEHILDGEFTVGQLNQLFNIFYDMAPSGSIPERVLTFIIQDIIFLDTQDGFRDNVPTLWKHVDPPNVGSILSDIFGDPEYVDWRDFLIYNMGIRFPTEKEIIRAWMTYGLYDTHKKEIIARKHYDYVRLWFEYDPTSVDDKTKEESVTTTTNTVSGIPGSDGVAVENNKIELNDTNTDSSIVPINPKELRARLLKDLLFKMFQVRENYLNYTGLLLAFCKDENPIIGLTKALSLTLRSLIGWDPILGLQREKNDVLEFNTEQEILRETDQQLEKDSESNLSKYNCVCGDTTILDYNPDKEYRNSDSSNTDDAHVGSSVSSITPQLDDGTKLNLKPMKTETEGEDRRFKKGSFVSIALAHLYSDEQLGLYNERVYFLPFEATLVTLAATLPWHIRSECLTNNSLRMLLEKIYVELYEKHGHGSIYAFKFLQHPVINDMLSTCFKFKSLYPPDIVRNYLRPEYQP